MALSGSQKKLLLLFLAFACLSDGSSSSGSGPGSDSGGSGWRWDWDWSWGSDGSSSGSGTNPDGSRWSWNWNPKSGWSWSWGPNNGGAPPSSKRSISDFETSRTSGSVLDSETPRKIIVGGSDGWRKGLDYKKWTSKNAPFYVNDVLVFKFDKSANGRNDVYLFQDPWSYMNCEIKNAKKIASTNKGSEESFEFTLTKLQPYFFASGEHEGDYCSNHNMKFTVFPIPHRFD